MEHLRTISLSFLIFILCVSSSFALDKIEIEATLDSDSQVISGFVIIDFEPKPVDLSALNFRLMPYHYNDEDDTTINSSIEIDSIYLNNETALVDYNIDETNLNVKLNDVINSGDSFRVQIYFRTIIPEVMGRFGLWENQYSLESWFPIPAPWRNNDWLIHSYAQMSEPVSDFFKISATTSFPDSMILMSPGIVSNESTGGITTTQLSAGKTLDLSFVIASGFQLHETTCDDINIGVYYRDVHQFAVDVTEQVACDVLRLMEREVGKYPFEQLVVVIGGLNVGGQLEHPRMVWTWPPERWLFTRNYESALTHEVIHQWFFGIVATDQVLDPWMDESITEYFTTKLNHELADGRGDIANVFGLTADYISSSRQLGFSTFDLYPITEGTGIYTSRQYGTVVYKKGSLIIGTICGIMGDSASSLFWHEYYERFKFTHPVEQDFIQLADQYMPRSELIDLSHLLNLMNTIDYSITDLSMGFIETIDSASDDKTRDEIIFKINIDYRIKNSLGYPVLLRAEFDDGSFIDTTIVATSGDYTWEFNYKSRPVAALIDPEFVYQVDRNWLNNSYLVNGNSGSGPRLFSGMLFLIESIFSTVWGL